MPIGIEKLSNNYANCVRNGGNMSEFSLSSCLNNPNEAFSAWVDYYYRGNKKEISSSDMGMITAHYSDKISDWKRIAKEEPDVTKYDLEISDQEYNKWMSEGEDDAKNATGYDNDGHREKLQNSNKIETSGALCSAGMTALSLTSKKTVDVTAKLIGKKASTKVATNIGVFAAVTAAAASAAAYKISKPNEDQYEAVMEMGESVLPEAQSQLLAEQDNMDAMREDIADAVTEAEETNEEGQEEIDNAKAEYDFYKNTYEALKEKVDSGESLTPDEKELYESVAAQLAETGQVIEDTAEDTSEEVTEHYDNIGTYQDGYDASVETIANVQGQIEYAADIDNSTKTACNVQAIAQTVNAASATTAAYKAGVKAAANWYNWMGVAYAAAAVVGAGAAVASGVFAVEQKKMSNEISGEIDVRQATSELNEVTSEIQRTGIEDLADTLDYVETGLVTEIPDDVESAESFDTTVPETTANDTTQKQTQTANNNPFAPNNTNNTTNTQTGNVQDKSETTRTQNTTDDTVTQKTQKKKKQ